MIHKGIQINEKKKETTKTAHMKHILELSVVSV